VSSPRARVAGLAALTLLAGGLRAVGLGGGLWIDEISSLLESFRPPLLQVLTVYPGDTQHPLYALLANLALKELGEANWVIRLPAAVVGAATVPLLYLFGRRVTTPRESFLAAGLLAVSYHHVWFSQSARGYTLLLFFAILSSLLLLEGLRRRRAAWSTAYAAAAALGAYTHLTMVFVVAAHAMLVGALLAADARRRERSRREGLRRHLALALLAFGGAAAATLLLYAPILSQLVRFMVVIRGATTTGSGLLPWMLDETVSSLGRGFGNGLGVAAAGATIAAGVLSYLRRDRVALWVLVGPGVVTLVGALAGRGYLVPRYFFPLAGFALLLAVRGVMVTVAAAALHAAPRLATARPGLAETAGTALLLLVIAASAIPTVRSLGHPKQDFVGAARWIGEHVPPEDRVVTVGVTNRAYRDWMSQPWTPLRRGKPGTLAELRRDGRRIWVVYTLPRQLARAHPDVLRAVREECGPGRRFPGTLGGGDVLVCPLEPLAGAAAAE
jgi:uncharacterized membrane protein